ncbi:alpha/beta hydrolase [Nostoc ellipsosporum NOK]|nr:alpha/beta hydrolase [Nostoc ellipsosporum NOK]
MIRRPIATESTPVMPEAQMFHPKRALSIWSCFVLWPIALSASAATSASAQGTGFRDAAAKVSLSTGSTVGEWILKGDAPLNQKAIVVFVHGGPGLYTEQRRLDEGAVFRRAGFTTAYYDRAGGGVSERLPAEQYSFEREIADLEAYRVHLNADRLILWGNSFGAALAAAYAARYPEHVAAMVLTSPGTFPGQATERDFSRTERAPVVMSQEMKNATLLIDGKGAAAERQLSQADAGRIFDDFVSSQLADGFLCKGAALSTPALPGGGNLYAQRLISKSAAKARPASIAPGRFPALIIRGSCDFMPAANAARYAGFFGGDLITLDAIGHGLLENRAAVDDAIANFLRRHFARS